MISTFPEPFFFFGFCHTLKFFLPRERLRTTRAQHARTIWWALVLDKGMVVEVMSHLVPGRTGARVPPELARRGFGEKQINEPATCARLPARPRLPSADRSAYLSGRSLLPFPRLASLSRYGADYVWSLSLSRNDCCCIFQPDE